MIVTNRCGLPRPFVEACRSEHVYRPGRYSVTDLLRGPCEAVLLHRHDDEVVEDCADMVWAVFGSAVHSVFENAPHEEWQDVEGCVEVEVCGYTLSGRYDMYDGREQLVVDYKTTSVHKMHKFDRDDRTDEWRMQTLVYAWMLERSGRPCRHAEVVAVCRDWSRRDAVREGYPDNPVVVVRWDFDDDDMAEAGRFVEDRFAVIAACEALPDCMLAPCSEDERWHKPDRWAVMRRGQDRAVKLFDDEASALEHMDWLANQPSNRGRGLYVECRPGEDVRCDGYCRVRRWCPLHADREGEREGE